MRGIGGGKGDPRSSAPRVGRGGTRTAGGSESQQRQGASLNERLDDAEQRMKRLVSIRASLCSIDRGRATAHRKPDHYPARSHRRHGSICRSQVNQPDHPSRWARDRRISKRPTPEHHHPRRNRRRLVHWLRHRVPDRCAGTSQASSARHHSTTDDKHTAASADLASRPANSAQRHPRQTGPLPDPGPRPRRQRRTCATAHCRQVSLTAQRHRPYRSQRSTRRDDESQPGTD